MHSLKFYYRCVDCSSEFDSNEIRYLCPLCSAGNNPANPPKGVLKVIYDYSKVTRNFSDLVNTSWLSLLPLNSLESWPKLRIGNTPLYRIKEGLFYGIKELYIKDDSQNPSFSFKDRASALVSAFAKENGIQSIVAASTGNAGSSLACICANQQQKAIIYVPASAPIAKRLQIKIYGARLEEVDGTYDDAYELSIKASKEFAWYNRNTAYNPLTVEGKKTVAFELFNQLNANLPEIIFVPVGDGVIISGLYKGLEELMLLGFIKSVPQVILVQSTGSPNLAKNLDKQVFKSEKSSTIADSISVDVPRNFYMARQFINKYDGAAITVSDDEIMEAASLLASTTGIFAEPAAAAAMAGCIKLNKENRFLSKRSQLVLSTGSGLKDVGSFTSSKGFSQQNIS